MAQLDERNRLAQGELETFASSGIFPARHPIAAQFLADRKTEQALSELKRTDPEAFLRQVANAEQNIRRLRSQLSKHHYSTDEERRRIEHNLSNAERLRERMKAVL